MKHSLKTTLAVAAGAVALAGVATVPAIVSAWSDNTEDGRPTYSLQEINEGALGDNITFNSIVFSESDYEYHKDHFGQEVPATTLTDERNFVDALPVTDDGGDRSHWFSNEIEVQNDQTYFVRLYIHNNNPNGYDAVAEDTKVTVNIPQETANSIRVDGSFSSTNSYPTWYSDHVYFKSDVPFHLEYVYGSAVLKNNGIGANGGVQLSDDIVNSVSGGVLIGYDALDGKVPGCYQYANYVTIQVKAVYDTEFTLEKQVRLKDGEDKTWQDSLNVQVGDLVEYEIAYQNTSEVSQANVIIRDVLPANLEYVPGSTILYNSTYPDGLVGDTDEIVNNGVNIGTYSAGANAFIRFTAKVVDENLACGSNTLVNWGRATVNETVLQDHAEVVLNKVCEEPTPEEPEADLPTELPNTGPEAIAGTVVALGSLGTAAGYYIASRRHLR